MANHLISIKMKKELKIVESFSIFLLALLLVLWNINAIG
jgi:hypothetical protein